jgi:hypothetical protein
MPYFCKAKSTFETEYSFARVFYVENELQRGIIGASLDQFR